LLSKPPFDDQQIKPAIQIVEDVTHERALAASSLRNSQKFITPTINAGIKYRTP
jgi:hypothetical protein